MRILIFGTTYVDTVERLRMVEQWVAINRRINPDCRLLLIDSASPVSLAHLDCLVLKFHDNLGHLARGGQDGWGRAFCDGLNKGIAVGYDYIAHVEGDSLFRLPVRPICEQMEREDIQVASVPVRGTKRRETDWVETGLMIFRRTYAELTAVAGKYDWQDCEPKRRYPHCPEWHMHRIVRPGLRMMPWSAERNDCEQITTANVHNYDWITHVGRDVADAFVRSMD